MRDLSIFLFFLVLLFSCSQQNEKPAEEYKLGDIHYNFPGSIEAKEGFSKGLLLLHSFEYEDGCSKGLYTWLSA